MVRSDLAPLVAFDAPHLSHFISISVWKMDKLQTDSSRLVNDSQVVCFWTRDIPSGSSRLPVLPPVPTS